MDDIKIITDEELKAQSREQQIEACCLIISGLERLSEASQLMESGSEELFSMMGKRTSLLEPLGILKSKCDFKDWMYEDWQEEQQSNCDCSDV